MLILSFLYAAILLGLGFLGLQGGADPNQARALGLPGLYFGGGALFCALFALKEPRHGLSGASFLAFIAFLTNSSTLVGALAKGAYDWSAPPHRIATLVWGVSALYLACAFTWWRRRRQAAALAELQRDDPE